MAIQSALHIKGIKIIITNIITTINKVSGLLGLYSVSISAMYLGPRSLSDL